MSDQGDSTFLKGRPLIEGEKFFTEKWPLVIYKYRDFEKAKSILSTKEIYFARPEEFDDPHDIAIPLRFDKIEKQELGRYLSVLFGNLPLPSQSFKYPVFTYDQIEELTFSAHLGPLILLRTLRKFVKVFCAAQNNDNYLLWSQYGENHKGVCIGFNSHHLGANTRSIIGKVKYFKEYPEIIPANPNAFENDLASSVLKKAEYWSYQEEYRMINFFPNQTFRVLPKAIEEVIFGLTTPKAKIDEIKEFIVGSGDLKHIKLYKTISRLDSYDLTIVPIE